MTDDHAHIDEGTRAWHARLHHTPHDGLSSDTAQTPGMTRYEAISGKLTGSRKLWMGRTDVAPGKVSSDHHHGEAETGGYVFKGNGFIRFGERYEDIIYMSEGDFVYVPPFVPHIEGNLSHTEELIWMTTRTPDNIVVNLHDQDVADIDIAYVD